MANRVQVIMAAVFETLSPAVTVVLLTPVLSWKAA